MQSIYIVIYQNDNGVSAVHATATTWTKLKQLLAELTPYPLEDYEGGIKGNIDQHLEAHLPCHEGTYVIHQVISDRIINLPM
jgi:hypothetical protein